MDNFKVKGGWSKTKRNIVIVFTLFILVFLGLSLTENKKTVPDEVSTDLKQSTIIECKSIYDKDSSISIELNECFNSLSEDEYIDLALEEEYRDFYQIYEETVKMFDTRTSEEKEKDRQETEDFWREFETEEQ
jgi:hypothetical protein